MLSNKVAKPTLVIPVVERLRLEDHNFKANLSSEALSQEKRLLCACLVCTRHCRKVGLGIDVVLCGWRLFGMLK